jgi:hypothetical protein
MEANEAQELREHAEHGSQEGMRPVAFTMSVLAVLVAVTTVLGHRAHTEAVLNQNRATDKWNEYQAHKIRSVNTELANDLLSVVTIQDKAAAQKIQRDYAAHEAKWAGDLSKLKEEADALEKSVESAEAHADRFDLGEALLEIGLVITSVTLLTRSRAYWYFGMAFAVLGIFSVLSAYFLHQ